MPMRSTFVQQERAFSAELHELLFSINQNNLKFLERELVSRSTPGSENYQQWLNFQEITDITQNNEGFVAAKEALVSHSDVNITWVSSRKDYFKAIAPVSVWEDVFQTKFYNWHDFDSSLSSNVIRHVRSTECVIPTNLYPHLSGIFN